MSNSENKINLNTIISNMNQKFPEGNLTEIEKSRYLYIELGKLLRYDIDMQSYFQIKAEDTYYKPVDMDNIKSNTFSCRQFAMIYTELLNRARYKC